MATRSSQSTTADWPAKAARPRSRSAAAATSSASRGSTAFHRSASSVTSRQAASGSCSAWATRSTATSRRSAVASASTATSVGPANPSIPTRPPPPAWPGRRRGCRGRSPSRPPGRSRCHRPGRPPPGCRRAATPRPPSRAAAPRTPRGRGRRARRGGQGDLVDPGRLGRDDVMTTLEGRRPARPGRTPRPGAAARTAGPGGPGRATRPGRPPLGQVELAGPLDRVEQGGPQLRPEGRLGGGQLRGGPPAAGGASTPSNRWAASATARRRAPRCRRPGRGPGPGPPRRRQRGAGRQPAGSRVEASQVDHGQHGNALHSTRTDGRERVSPYRSLPGQRRPEGCGQPVASFPTVGYPPGRGPIHEWARFGHAPPPGVRARTREGPARPEPPGDLP